MRDPALDPDTFARVWEVDDAAKTGLSADDSATTFADVLRTRSVGVIPALYHPSAVRFPRKIADFKYPEGLFDTSSQQ